MEYTDTVVARISQAILLLKKMKGTYPCVTGLYMDEAEKQE